MCPLNKYSSVGGLYWEELSLSPLSSFYLENLSSQGYLGTLSYLSIPGYLYTLFTLINPNDVAFLIYVSYFFAVVIPAVPEYAFYPASPDTLNHLVIPSFLHYVASVIVSKLTILCIRCTVRKVYSYHRFSIVLMLLKQHSLPIRRGLCLFLSSP